MKNLYFQRLKKFFEVRPSAEVIRLIATKQNNITDITLIIGFFMWPIWIAFDYLFAPEVWKNILPIRILGALVFILTYLYRNKLSFEQKQEAIFWSISLALGYMFALIDKESMPTYFTGFTFTTAFMFQTFHINRRKNLVYFLSTLSIFFVAYFFNRHSFLEILGGGGFATLTILLLMVFIADSNYRNNINSAEKTILIQEQKQDIENKNRAITESLTYAKRIQMSILPDDESIRKNFTSMFVIYKPCDIVSGDFYWFVQNQDKIIIAVADCTGHGVPGAFMTLINNNLLNQVIKENKIHEPHKVLQYVREKLITTLNTYQKNEYIKDGMDISLISIDKNTLSIQFSGANRPLWIIRHETKSQIEEIKGDKVFIGYDEQWESKELHVWESVLKKKDRIYLFTDGIVDQFGGDKDKKFGIGRLKETLIQTAEQPLEIQKNNLKEVLTKWQGSNPQTDDMCIIGIEV
ncbi:MAG: SpoIIE family protein phosphatase [Bacteroidia bacterium]|nr:SpoIIE family protein phosphatase [Bacteroidia bacterium]MDW8346263.1 SpoIIE family protein phosphatase [Bacteroidia bacterium]